MQSDHPRTPETDTSLPTSGKDGRRAFTLLRPLWDAIQDLRNHRSDTDSTDPFEDRPVWGAVEHWMRALNRPTVRWSETQDEKDQTASTLLLAIDREVDVALRATVQAAQSVIDVGASKTSAYQGLGLACAMLIRDQLTVWDDLRRIHLNEASYEAWLGIHQSAARMHAHIQHLVGQLSHQQRIEYSPAPDEPLNTVAGRLLAKLLETASLTPELAAHIVQCAREMRHDLEVITSQRREPMWQTLLQHFDDPFYFHGSSIATTAGLFPRPMVWPVLPGEEKRSGAFKYRAGVHYKRHSERVQVLTIKAHYQVLAQALHLHEPEELGRAREGETEPETNILWRTLQQKLSVLRQTFYDAMEATELLYTHVGASPRQDGVGEADDPDSIYPDQELERTLGEEADRQSVILNQRLWIGGKDAIFLKGEPAQVQQRLEALDLEDSGLFDSTYFCLACYRTATSRNYCLLHAGSDPRAKREVRSMSRQFHNFTELLVEHRKARFSLWKAEFVNPAHRSFVIQQPLSCSDVLYRLYNFGEWRQPARTIEGALLQARANLNSLQLVIQPFLDSLSIIDPANSLVPKVKAMLDPSAIPLDAPGASRWLRIVRSLEQMADLARDVMRLAQYVRIAQGVTNRVKVEPSLGSNELEKFTRRYVVNFLQALLQERQDCPALQQVPDALNQHFFGIWFYGGAWGQAQDNVQQQKDGNPQILNEIIPLRLAQQIERWAIWQSISASETPRQKHGHIEMDDVLMLRESGQTMPQIAARLGISYDALRMALLRYERRMAEITAGKTIRPRGRPRKERS